MSWLFEPGSQGITASALYDFKSTCVFNIALSYNSLSTVISIIIDFKHLFLASGPSYLLMPVHTALLSRIFARLYSHSDPSLHITSLWKPFLITSFKVAICLITFNDNIL